jgi:subtilisin-like proprotein convertase family protein
MLPITIRPLFAFAVSCSALALIAAPASASAPAPPRNCGAPVTASLTNPTPAPPADLSTVTSTIVVSGLAPNIGDVDVITSIASTSALDIDMTVTSPAGTVVTLTTDNGGSFDNVFAGTRWDDDAAPAGVPTSTITPFAGNVQIHPYANLVGASPLAPEEALGAFIGENPNGTWTLTVRDDTAGAPATLSSWGLDIQSLPAAPPPVSASSYTESPGTAISAVGTPVITSTIDTVGEGAYLGDVDVTTNILHTMPSDLQIALTSPAGTTVFLTTGVFAPGFGVEDNVWAGTLWNDDANPGGQVPYTTNAGLASDHPYANSVLASPLAPNEGFAAFRGENPNGTWTLTVADQFGGEGGALTSWGLLLTPARCDVPDTAIDSGPAEGATVTSPDATFTFSSLPAGAATGFECSLDGGAFTSCTGSRQVTGMANGPHTFRVAALGDNPDRDLTPATRTWTVNVPAAPPDPGGGVPAPPGGGGGGTPKPPVVITSPSVSSFSISPSKPRAGKTITLKWRLSKAGTVTIAIERLVKRKFASLGRVTTSAKAGSGSLKLAGKIGKKKLPAGSYRATISATAPGATKASAAKTVRFTIGK